MSAAKARKVPLRPLSMAVPAKAVLTYDRIEDRIENARATIFEAQNVLQLVEAGAAPNNEQPVSLWNVYEAMKMAGRLLSDAATQLEYHALTAAKPEEACHE